MASRIDMTKICLLLLIIFILAAPSAGQNNFLEGHDSNRMALSIHVDRAGKSLVTGYAEDIKGLDFLSASHYRYKNETGQLYALTGSLTSKQGDNWTLRFVSEGYYDEYHAKFLLPGETRLRKISCSAGMEYIVYTSNESFVAEIVGYDLRDPAATLEYQMPLEDAPGSNASASINFSYLLIAVLAVLGISAVTIWSGRMRVSRFIKAASIEGSVEPDLHTGTFRSETAQMSESDSESSPKGRIIITREMAAVMEVLTTRERTVLEALLKHGGSMTQAEIRYETETPGSTLTGILISLERRKFVTKKEQGRTNVIELSKWFLSKKEDS